jgi:hypothetical protein
MYVCSTHAQKIERKKSFQSDNLPALWIILQSLEKRLHRRFARNKQVATIPIITL